jgi:hypothetical protein
MRAGARAWAAPRGRVVRPTQRDGRRVGRTSNVVTLEVSQLVSGWLKAIAPVKVLCDAEAERKAWWCVRNDEGGCEGVGGAAREGGAAEAEGRPACGAYA